MKLRNHKQALILTASTMALVVGLPALAQAQDSGSAAGGQTPQVETVIVTGSRIQTATNRAISPVRVIGAEDIRATGLIDIDEVLKQQNQFLPSNGATTNPTLLESHGASTLDMRGLGQNRTLVLVNGQRVTPNGFRNSADVNTIPSALIARVETLTGGAAAVYGADAVAGVTNYILRDRYEGVEVAISGGISEQGDAENYSVGITAGKNFFDDRANIVVHASYADRGDLKRTDRAWALPEVNDAGQFIQTFPTARGAFTRWANATTAPGGATAPTFAFGADGTLGTTAGTQAFSQFEAFQNPNDRTNYAVFGNFKLAKWAEFYGRGTYSLINNTSQQVPVRSNGNGAAVLPVTAGGANLITQADVLIQRTNPFLTPAILSILNPTGGTSLFNLNAAGTGPGTDAARFRVAKTLLELGPIRDETERTSHQLVLGVRGELTDTIRYDLSYVTGKSIEEVQRIGWGSWSRFLQATNATTVGGQPACVDPSGGCVPFNLFGPSAASAAAVAWINGNTSELFTRDTLHTQGARANLVADFELTEYYGELRLPVLADKAFFKQFDVEAAGRWSDHSRSGDYDTWKLGVNWAVNDTLRLRGSKQTVVRGPNIGEFFGAAVEAPITGTGRPTDYCSDPARFNVPTSLCQALGAPSTPGYIPVVGTGLPLIDNAVAVQGGGEAIKPESGETYTYGFVLTPQFVPGLSIVVDYYNIQIDDAIGSITPIQLMDSCYLVLQDPNSALCRKITRDSNGRVVKFDQRDTNLTLLKTSGIDFSIYYNAKLPEALPGDRINISFQGGTVDSFVRLLFPADNLFDCAGDFGGGACSDAGTGIRAIPAFRSNLAVAWTDGPLTIRGAWRYQGQVDALIKRVPEPQWRNVAPNLNAVQHIDAWDYFDLGFSYRINDNLRIGGTVINVFDKDPPILGSAQQDANTLPNQYDIIGRRYAINLVWKM